MKLFGEDIYLRKLELSDAEGNYPNWLNDKEVCKYNSHGDTLYTKEMAREYIKKISTSSSHLVLAICDTKSNKHIGNISLQQISQKNHSAEFAILLGEKSFWGKGLAKQASKLLIDYGFSQLKLHRIYCGTSTANTPMQKLALHIGMQAEGIRKDALCKNDTFFDVLEYGIVH